MILSGGPAAELATYVQYLQAAGRSPGTIKLRLKYLERLAREADVDSLWEVDADELTAFMARPEWAPETRKSARASIRGLYEWGLRTGRIDHDPSRFLPQVTVPPTVARPASDVDFVAALAAAQPRERLMVMLAAYAGLRRAEIAGIHGRDILADRIRVRGKGGRVREVPLHPALAAELAPTDGYLFPGQDGGHLSPNRVGVLIARLLPPGWTAHTLRHRFASRAYACERDVFAVQRLLGHSKPETTMRYVAVSDSSLRAAVLAN